MHEPNVYRATASFVFTDWSWVQKKSMREIDEPSLGRIPSASPIWSPRRRTSSWAIHFWIWARGNRPLYGLIMMGGWLLSLLSLFVCFINARFVRFNQILEEHDNRNTPRTVKSEGMQAILLSLTGKPVTRGQCYLKIGRRIPAISILQSWPCDRKHRVPKYFEQQVGSLWICWIRTSTYRLQHLHKRSPQGTIPIQRLLFWFINGYRVNSAVEIELWSRRLVLLGL